MKSHELSNRWLLRGLAGMAVLALLTLSAPARAQVIADSIADWSATGVQGENSWYYGWFDLTDDELNDDGLYEEDNFIEYKNDPDVDVRDQVWIPGAEVNHWLPNNGGSWRLDVAQAPWTIEASGPKTGASMRLNWLSTTDGAEHLRSSASGRPSFTVAAKRAMAGGR